MKSENKNPEGAANLIRKLQLIQQALINNPSTGRSEEDQDADQREEAVVEPLIPRKRRKGKKKRRNELKDARTVLEESGKKKIMCLTR